MQEHMYTKEHLLGGQRIYVYICPFNQSINKTVKSIITLAQGKFQLLSMSDFVELTEPSHSLPYLTVSSLPHIPNALKADGLVLKKQKSYITCSCGLTKVYILKQTSLYFFTALNCLFVLEWHYKKQYWPHSPSQKKNTHTHTQDTEPELLTHL